jgi:molecular chaperone DnaK
MQRVAVGLDLGTTISVAAYVDESGEPQVVPDREAGPLIPSGLFFADHVIAGQAAIDRSERALDNFAYGYKRDIGKPHYRKRLRNHDVPPEILTAFLVEYLAENVRRAVGDVSEVVVTVPAYFDERQRSSTQRSVVAAGLKVLDIINEPTAAAIAAGYEMIRSAAVKEKHRLLVYDLGGGTFDATLLEIDGRVFRTLGTDGDIYLGGRDFNERIAAILADSFVASHGVDPRSDPNDSLKLASVARDVKHALSEADSTAATIQHAGLTHTMTVTRPMFEDAVGPLIERTVMTSQAVISDAGLRWDDVDQILLVGGSSRIPLVRQRLESETNKPVSLSKQPDELVSRGAALYAALRSEQAFLDVDSQFEVVNVNAHSLGIQGVDLETKQRVNKIIIPRNTPLPASATESFPTIQSGQQNVSIRLLEGESENPIYCSALGKCVVKLDQPLPKGTPVRVCCRYDDNGTISVTADVPGTSASASAELVREGCEELEPLAIWRERLLDQSSAKTSKAPTKRKPVLNAFLGPDSNLNELLTRLDQLYAHVGYSALSASVPPSAESLKRLLIQTKTEAATLKYLVERLTYEQEEQKNPEKRMRLQRDLAQVRIAWDQANRLHLHSCIGLGRSYFHEQPQEFVGTPIANQVSELEQWLDDRTSHGSRP